MLAISPSGFLKLPQCFQEHLHSGRLKHRETILEGFERMPNALMSLFSGDNIGKLLVQRFLKKQTVLTVFFY